MVSSAGNNLPNPNSRMPNLPAWVFAILLLILIMLISGIMQSI